MNNPMGHDDITPVDGIPVALETDPRLAPPPNDAPGQASFVHVDIARQKLPGFEEETVSQGPIAAPLQFDWRMVLLVPIVLMWIASLFVPGALLGNLTLVGVSVYVLVGLISAARRLIAAAELAAASHAEMARIAARAQLAQEHAVNEQYHAVR